MFIGISTNDKFTYISVDGLLANVESDEFNAMMCDF